MPPSSSEKAHWTEAETTAFVNYLYEHRGQGEAGKFKTSVFTQAAEHIRPLLSQGPVKTEKTLKTKWQGVSAIGNSHFTIFTHFAAETNISSH